MASNTDNGMDSANTTRTTTPTPSSRCMRLQDLATTLNKLAILVDGTENIISNLQRSGTFDKEDPNVTQTLASLHEYTSLQAQAEGVQLLTPPTCLLQPTNQNPASHIQDLTPPTKD